MSCHVHIKWLLPDFHIPRWRCYSQRGCWTTDRSSSHFHFRNAWGYTNCFGDSQMHLKLAIFHGKSDSLHPRDHGDKKLYFKSNRTAFLNPNQVALTSAEDKHSTVTRENYKVQPKHAWSCNIRILNFFKTLFWVAHTSCNISFLWPHWWVHTCVQKLWYEPRESLDDLL